MTTRIMWTKLPGNNKRACTFLPRTTEELRLLNPCIVITLRLKSDSRNTFRYEYWINYYFKDGLPHSFSRSLQSLVGKGINHSLGATKHFLVPTWSSHDQASLPFSPLWRPLHYWIHSVLLIYTIHQSKSKKFFYQTLLQSKSILPCPV